MRIAGLMLAELALFDDVKDRLIQTLFGELGFHDEPPGIGLEVSEADTMLADLSTHVPLCPIRAPAGGAGRSGAV